MKAKLRKSLHKKKMVGSHFVRLVSFTQVEEGTDSRVYKDTNDNPLIEENAIVFYEKCVKYIKQVNAFLSVQLFERGGRIVREYLDMFGDRDIERRMSFIVGHSQFRRITESVARCGRAYSFCKQNRRYEIREYEGGLREYVSELPLREIHDIGDMEVEIDKGGGNSLLKAYLDEAIENGASVKVALNKAFSKFHVSQGRCGKPLKRSLRPRAFCSFCKKIENKKKFMGCARCKMVFYCGKKCQKADWTKHKKMCKQV